MSNIALGDNVLTAVWLDGATAMNIASVVIVHTFLVSLLFREGKIYLFESLIVLLILKKFCLIFFINLKEIFNKFNKTKKSG